MKVSYSSTFMKSLEELDSFKSKLKGIKWWIKYHTSKSFFRVLREVFRGNPWSSDSLLRLEKEKLIELADYLEKSNRYVGVEYDIRDIRICIGLLNIILEDRSLYHTTGDIKFLPTGSDGTGEIDLSDLQFFCDIRVNTGNISRFETRPNVQKYLLDNPWELYRIKARKLYHKIREEHEEAWSD